MSTISYTAARENLAATMYDALGIPRHATWTDIDGRPHKIYHGLPMEGLT